MIINEENYVKKAEKVISELDSRLDKKGRKIGVATTSQIRNILAMSADIYNLAIVHTEDKLPENIISKIEYLKIRIIYDAGRDNKVKDLVKEAKLIECISEINGSKKNFILFNHYIEAIVAYRKYIGKDS